MRQREAIRKSPWFHKGRWELSLHQRALLGRQIRAMKRLHGDIRARVKMHRLALLPWEATPDE